MEFGESCMMNCHIIKLFLLSTIMNFYACITVATTLTSWELWLVRKTEDERRRIEKEREEKVGLLF